MRTKMGRAALVGLAAVAVTAMHVQPGGAAPSVTKTYSYAATSEGSGVGITLAPGGQTAQVIGGGFTSARADLAADGKFTSKGSAEAVKGNASVSVSSEAPPDSGNKHAQGGALNNAGIPNVLTLSGEAGSADSASEAKDKTPSSTTSATFGATTITAGPSAVLQAKISIGAVSTEADAEGKAKEASSTSTSHGVVISLSVEPAALQQLDGQANQVQGPLCGGLAQIPTVGDELSGACNALFDSTAASVEYATITIGEGNATCTWKDGKPAASGQGATVRLSVLGQQVAELKPGSTPTTVGTGTPLELTVGAGSFVSPEPTDGGFDEDDKVTGTASGAFADLLAKSVRLAFSSSSCAIAAKIATDKVLASTGGTVLPSLLGGAGLIAGAFRLRRFLRIR